MLETLAEWFSGKGCVETGYKVWNALVEIGVGLFSSSPSTLAGGALWRIITSLLVSMKLIGASLFTLLFLINFCKKTTDLKSGMTMEVEFELLIKLILGDFVIVNIDFILNSLIEIMQAMLGIVSPGGIGSIMLDVGSLDDWDNDSFVIGLLIGAVFMIMCVAAGVIIILHVYTIYFKLYYYIVVSPLAMASIAGPEGAARSAESWLKTIICCLMEFVGSMLMLRLCAVLLNSNGFFISSPWKEWESLWNIIQAMIFIAITVSSVKTVDNLTRRAFGF